MQNSNVTSDNGKVVKTDAEWQKILTPEQYDVARKHSTEPAFRNKYWDNHEKGIYRCVACYRRQLVASPRGITRCAFCGSKAMYIEGDGTREAASALRAAPGNKT